MYARSVPEKKGKAVFFTEIRYARLLYVLVRLGNVGRKGYDGETSIERTTNSFRWLNLVHILFWRNETSTPYENIPVQIDNKNNYS